MSVKRAVGVAVLALSVALLWLVFQPEAAPAPAREFTSSQQCIACHEQAGAEWSASWHAQAWNDPDVRALSNDFANSDCIDCHAPRPVFETGLGQRVLPRASRRAEGVDCITCHLLPEGPDGTGGGVAGTLDDPAAPCRPRALTDLARPELCAPCHDQHKTVEQWRASKWAEQGVDCLDCHMPYRGGDPARGRDHAMHGAHALGLVQRAVVLRARREGARVEVELENVGAGHSFPTDERSRAADLFWRPLAEAGTSGGAWRHLYRFRSPYRDETELTDTLLPAHATHRTRIEAPEAAGALEVALFFKLTPYWEDPEHPDPERECRLVQRVEVGP